MRLVVCGARGSTPAPGGRFLRYGGHTSCLAISRRGGPPDLLLDAGTGIRGVTRLLAGDPFAGSILLGHLHWDHIQGLPFFTGGDHPGARVDLYAPDEGTDLAATLAGAMGPPFFPVTPADLHGTWRFLAIDQGARTIEGYEVLSREIPHKGGRTFGYRITDGARSFAYLSDHDPTLAGEGADGHGSYHDAAMELAAGVDVLVHDAQYGDGEQDRASAFGHSTGAYAVGLAEKAGVGRLLMFHHDPSRTDVELDRMIGAWADGATVPVEGAVEGLVIDVDGDRRR